MGNFLNSFLGRIPLDHSRVGKRKGDVCAGRVVWPNGPQALITSSGQGGGTRPG